MRVPVRGSSLVRIPGGIVRDDDLIRLGLLPVEGASNRQMLLLSGD